MKVRINENHNCPFFEVNGAGVDDKTGIRTLRRERKLSTKEIGDLAGVSERTVEGWEQGRSITRPSMLLLKWRLDL